MASESPCERSIESASDWASRGWLSWRRPRRMDGTCVETRRGQRVSRRSRGAETHIGLLAPLLDLGPDPLGEEEQGGEQDVEDLAEDEANEVEGSLVRPHDRLDDFVKDIG